MINIKDIFSQNIFDNDHRRDYDYLTIHKSRPLEGQVHLSGAKNSVLVIMASLILTCGKSYLKQVPVLSDVLYMIELLKSLGAHVVFDKNNGILEVDTTNISKGSISEDIMNKMRASILALGPILSRFNSVDIALPGGCLLGSRPIDLHLNAFKKMGATVVSEDNIIKAYNKHKRLKSIEMILDYPSVGATENILMAAVLAKGKTKIINAALEPEVFDLINVLKKMGAQINCYVPNTIEVVGVEKLNPIKHDILLDRLEAGSFLLASAITKGSLVIEKAPVNSLGLFLDKLREMGHTVICEPINDNNQEYNSYSKLIFKSIDKPKAVSFKTMPYPGFPTDLQAPFMATLTQANGISMINETVYENRLSHVKYLNKLQSNIKILNEHNAQVSGITELIGTDVNASNIRAGCALILAGLVAQGVTRVHNVAHLHRGYQDFVEQLKALGADISYESYAGDRSLNKFKEKQ